MRFAILNHLRPTPVAPSLVSRDADELMQVWGGAALDQASKLSWKEDSGLLSSPAPGHWWRVSQEVERRLGRRTAAPQVDIAA